MHRFYIPSAVWDPGQLTLGEGEAHHLRDVLRLKAGDKVVAFDGKGTEATASIAEVAKRSASLETLTVTKSPPPPAAITLAQAVPKGKAMDFIVQKATELAAAAVIPLVSRRTVVQIDPNEAAKKRKKWQLTAVGACKQSGQNRLPEIAPPVTVERLFQSGLRYDLLLVASLQPDSQKLKDILAEHAELNGGSPPSSALVLIGPEGDFTPAEINLARSAGCQPMGLGPIVLRSETAALYALSVLAHELF